MEPGPARPPSPWLLPFLGLWLTHKSRRVSSTWKPHPKRHCKLNRIHLSSYILLFLFFLLWLYCLSSCCPKTHLPRARGFPSPNVSGFGLFFPISFPPPHSGPHRFSPEPPSWPPCLRLCVTQIIMLPSYLKLSESLIPIRWKSKLLFWTTRPSMAHSLPPF